MSDPSSNTSSGKGSLSGTPSSQTSVSTPVTGNGAAKSGSKNPRRLKKIRILMLHGMSLLIVAGFRAENGPLTEET